MVGNGDELSRKTAIPRSTLESYLTGDSEPKASRLAAIAQAAGVSLDWLVLGSEPMRPGEGPPPVGVVDAGVPAHTDETLMGRLVDGITAAYKDHGAAIAPLHLGQLAARLHNEVIAVAEEPEDYPGAVKMRLAQLRQELRQAAIDPASSKRQA